MTLLNLVLRTTSFCFAACLLVLSVWTASPVHAATITLSANRDNNLLRSSFAGTPSGRPVNDINLGGGERFAVGISGGADNRSIVGFDVAPLPEFAAINSVTLRLTFDRFVLTQDYTKAIDLEVYQISAANADWVEGTGTNDGSPSDDVGSTWLEKNRGVSNWASVVGTPTPATGGLAVAGVDYEPTLLASVTAGPTLPADNTVFDFVFTGTPEELTSLVQGWEVTNPGFLLLTPTTGLANNRDRLFFTTSEGPLVSERPQLLIEFTAIPEPSGFALFGCALTACLAARRRRRVRPTAAAPGSVEIADYH